jgi:hypothetical protein
MRKTLKSTRDSSTIIQVGFDKKTIKLMHDIENEWTKRFEEARLFFLLDVGNYMYEEIKKRAPDIEIGGKNRKYAEDLRVGLLEEGEDEDVIAIYLDGEKAEITSDDKGRTVLYFKPHNGSPKWVSILMRYGPWPADMVPVKVEKNQSKVISRLARDDELKELSERLFRQRSKIELDLSKAGAKSPHVGYTDHGIGLMSHVDLGYNVLRKELGLDGQKQDPHWRPVFKDTKKYAKECMFKVIKYIETGNKNIFNLPKYDKIGSSVIKDGYGFSKEIAPFLK